jgi:hypothetical protein
MSFSLSDPSLLKSQAYINGLWVDADNGEIKYMLMGGLDR